MVYIDKYISIVKMNLLVHVVVIRIHGELSEKK